MLIWILLLNFYEKVLFCLWVMLSFSELEFKWSVHVINVLNQLHTTYTWFPYCLQWFISIMALRSVKKLAMLPQIWLYAYWNKYCNVQMKLHRAAII